MMLLVMCGRTGISSVRKYDSRSMAIQGYLYRPSEGYYKSLLMISMGSQIFLDA